MKDVGMSTCTCYPYLIILSVYFLALPSLLLSTMIFYTCLCHLICVILNQWKLPLNWNDIWKHITQLTVAQEDLQKDLWTTSSWMHLHNMSAIYYNMLVTNTSWVSWLVDYEHTVYSQGYNYSDNDSRYTKFLCYQIKEWFWSYTSVHVFLY